MTQESIISLLVGAAGTALLLAVARVQIRRITIFEYERGLRYWKGRFRDILQPGAHWFLSWRATVVKVDIRPRFVTIPGQEILSADGVTLKASIAAKFEIADAATAINKVENYLEALYLELQLCLREIVGATEIEAVLAARAEIAKKLQELAAPRAEALGLRLLSVSVKDIMFPGKLKEVFAQVVSARKEGQAALERARGETAALRNLANAARLVEESPHLMQLRLLQTIGGSSGNTLVLGMPGQNSLLPVARPAGAPPPAQP